MICSNIARSRLIVHICKIQVVAEKLFLCGPQLRFYASSFNNKDIDDAEGSPQQRTSRDNSGEIVVENTQPPASRRRNRHQFDSKLTEIPRFDVFQQQQQVRRLYRQFLRLFYSVNEDSSRREMLQQVRRQFKQHNQHSSVSSWEIKRAISEGNKRFKEVSAMLGSVISPKQKGSNRSDIPKPGASTDHRTVNNPSWPWQQMSDDNIRKRPLPFPKKSGL